MSLGARAEPRVAGCAQAALLLCPAAPRKPPPELLSHTLPPALVSLGLCSDPFCLITPQKGGCGGRRVLKALFFLKKNKIKKLPPMKYSGQAGCLKTGIIIPARLFCTSPGLAAWGGRQQKFPRYHEQGWLAALVGGCRCAGGWGGVLWGHWVGFFP